MGFETSLFKKPVDENLTCSLCLGVFDKPTTACSNGHVYCEGCLTKTLARRDACPDCRMPILDFAPLNRPVQNMIVGLKLCCEYSKPIADGTTNDDEAEEPPAVRRRTTRSGAAVKGGKKKKKTDVCDWQGLVSEYHEHAKSCEFRIVSCPLGCKSEIVLRLLEHHKENECKFRRVTCPKCDKIMKKVELIIHNKYECPEKEVKCQYCQVEMKLKERGCALPPRESFDDESRGPTGHYTVCPKLKCEFCDVGCCELVPREEMAAHHVDMARYHANLVSNRLSDIQHWEHTKVDWEIMARRLIGTRRVSIDSPFIPLFGHNFYFRLHLDWTKVEIELCVSGRMTSDMTIRNINVELEVQYPIGDDSWYTARAIELENSGKSRTLRQWDEHSSFGRYPFTFEYHDSDDEGDNSDGDDSGQNVEVTRQILSAMMDDGCDSISIDASFKVKRPSKISFISS